MDLEGAFFWAVKMGKGLEGKAGEERLRVLGMISWRKVRADPCGSLPTQEIPGFHEIKLLTVVESPSLELAKDVTLSALGWVTNQVGLDDLGGLLQPK